jgi:hypothetical protein
VSVFGIILAVLKAIPVLDSWFQQLTVLYFNAQVSKMKAENRDAVKKALDEHDQRDLEKATGNSQHSGEHSGETSSEIISGPPPGVGS